MPQLDTLTYFSQFIYLVASFVAVYALALQFIIPQVVAAQKLRQKLNSITLVTTKLERSEAFSNVDLFATYDDLVVEKGSRYAKSHKPWPVSARLVQICQTLQLKKISSLQNITSAGFSEVS